MKKPALKISTVCAAVGIVLIQAALVDKAHAVTKAIACNLTLPGSGIGSVGSDCDWADRTDNDFYINGEATVRDTLNMTGGDINNVATLNSTTIDNSGKTTTDTLQVNSGSTLLGATSINATGGANTTIGTSGTSVNQILGAQNIIQGVQSTAQAAPSVQITGQNGSTAVNGPTSVTTGQSAGVYIQGAATTPGAYDVYIGSQNGQTALTLSNGGVQLLVPTLTGTQTVTNNLGNAGTSTDASVVTNNLGLGSSGTGTVYNNVGNATGVGAVINTFGSAGSANGVNVVNQFGGGGSSNGGTVTNTIGQGSSGSTVVTTNIGQSVAGGGAVINNVGGGDGTSTNNFGAVGGSGSATNNFGSTTTATSTVTNNIGTGPGASTNTLGNSNANTTVNLVAGSSSFDLSDNGAHLTTGGSSFDLGGNGANLSSGSSALSVGPGGIGLSGGAIGLAANQVDINAGQINLGSGSASIGLGRGQIAMAAGGSTLDVTPQQIALATGSSGLNVTKNLAQLKSGSSTFDVADGQMVMDTGSSKLNLTRDRYNVGVGSSSMTVVDGQVSLTAGAPLASNGTTGTSSAQGAGGIQTYAMAKSVGADASIGNALQGRAYQNQVSGNLLVDGNLYVNGAMDMVSSGSAHTTVLGAGTGTSVLEDASQAVRGSNAIVMRGAVGTHTQVDANGKLINVQGEAPQSSASLTLTNGMGNTHGVVVTESQTTLSGGTQSSSLTLNDSGASFSNSATGKAVRVQGVAPGSTDTDAVNYRQLKDVMAGVAGTAAMANIPAPDQGKSFSVGVGLGNYQSATALAVGATYRVTHNAVIRGSVATVGGGGIRRTVYGVGMGMSW